MNYVTYVVDKYFAS